MISLEKQKEQLFALGLDYEQLIIILQKRLSEISAGAMYYSLHLPISDEKLIKVCQEQCLHLGYNWNDESNLANKFLLFKHSLRDRSEIKLEREKQLMQRRNKRPHS